MWVLARVKHPIDLNGRIIELVDDGEGETLQRQMVEVAMDCLKCHRMRTQIIEGLIKFAQKILTEVGLLLLVPQKGGEDVLTCRILDFKMATYALFAAYAARTWAFTSSQE